MKAAKYLPLADLLYQVHVGALDSRSYDNQFLFFAMTLRQWTQLSINIAI